MYLWMVIWLAPFIFHTGFLFMIICNIRRLVYALLRVTKKVVSDEGIGSVCVGGGCATPPS